MAEWNTAVHAARPLSLKSLVGEVQVKFVPVPDPLQRRPVGRDLAEIFDEAGLDKKLFQVISGPGRIASDKLHMPFFAWLAQTPRMIRLARVASTGVHIEKLIFDPDVFLRESIRIPASLEEQQHIAAILDTADHELTLLRTQRNALDQQKCGLMQRLLTGKVRVKPN